MLKFNLLPPKEKKEIEIANLSRFIAFVSAQLLALLAVFVILLLTTYFYLSTLVKAQDRLIEIEQKDTRTQRLADIEGMIKQTNQIIDHVFANQKKTILLTPILEEITRIVPTGVYLTNFSYQRETNQIKISGRADQREDFLLFQKNISEDALFTELESPLSNLLKQKEVDFNFSFKIKESSER